MNKTNHTEHIRLGVWIFALLMLGFVLSQPSNVLCQSNVTTSGGTIGKIPKWTAGTTLG